MTPTSQGTPPNPPSWSRETVTAVCTIVLAIAGLATLFFSWRGDDREGKQVERQPYNIAARGVTSPFVLPPSFRVQTSELSEAIRALEPEGPCFVIDPKTRKRRDNEAAFYGAWKRLSTAQSELVEAAGFRSFVQVEVANTSERAASNVAVETPYRGEYRATAAGRIETGHFDGGISLGSIQPGSPVTVEWWANGERSGPTKASDRPRVTIDEGKVVEISDTRESSPPAGKTLILLMGGLLFGILAVNSRQAIGRIFKLGQR